MSTRNMSMISGTGRRVGITILQQQGEPGDVDRDVPTDITGSRFRGALRYGPSLDADHVTSVAIGFDIVRGEDGYFEAEFPPLERRGEYWYWIWRLASGDSHLVLHGGLRVI